MYKKKNRQNKRFYFILFTIIFTIALVIFFNKQNFLTTPFFRSAKDFTEQAKNFIISPINNFTNKIRNIGQYDKLIKENEELNKENQELKIIKEQNDELQEEITKLEKELSLTEVYTNYELETASITSRNVDYWFNQITINKGSNSGISPGNAVVTVNGLIGKVINTTKNASTIKLITTKDKDIKISVGVKGTNGYHHGTIIDYQDGFLIVEGITNYDGVNINSKVLTSGLGTFPSGILVGYVSKIEKDNYDTSKILYVETKQDINDLQYVTVLKTKQ